MYDGFLNMAHPQCSKITDFADDAIIVCSLENVNILEIRINERSSDVKLWIDKRFLQKRIEKPEAMLVIIF